MLRTFSVVILISTVVGVIKTIYLYAVTYMHFVIYIMFNVLYRRRLLSHMAGSLNVFLEGSGVLNR
jgi:hypothetical protein